MVYSQICEWLNDFIEADPPSELYDTWDCTEWIEDSEVVGLFNEVVIPTFKTKKARDDSDQILHTLIWEYYTFRREEALKRYTYDSSVFDRLKNVASVPQHSSAWLTEKYDLLTASEFSSIIGDSAERNNILRAKTVKRLRSENDENEQKQINVCLTSSSGKIQPMMWGHRFEPVVRKLYETISGNTVYTGLGRLRHPTLTKLAASPDGVISNGSLLEIKAPITRELEKDNVPYEYYCQMQIQMAVCDVGIAEYCECRFKTGDTFSDTVAGVPPFVGALAVFGVPNNMNTWQYIYSPLYPDTKEGRLNALSWKPDVDDTDKSSSSADSECQSCSLNINSENGNAEFTTCNKCMNPGSVILETKVWQIEDWQVIKVLRNPRWWSLVGAPEYHRFFKDVAAAKADPMFLKPNDFSLKNSGGGALFVDEDELYGDVKNTVE
jgi:hypothetical protein